MRFDVSNVKVRSLCVSDADVLRNEFGIGDTIFKNDDVIVFGAFWDCEIIGFVSTCNLGRGVCLLPKLKVIPMFQNHGVSHMLLRETEVYYGSRGYHLMRCMVDDDTRDFDIIVKMLMELGWRNSGIDHNYYRIIRRDAQRSFIGRHSENPESIDIPGISIKNLTQISNNEWETLEGTLDLIPETLRPMRKRADLIEDLTLFLIEYGRIIGWVTTTRRGDSEVCVENVYVFDEYRENGYGLLLIGGLYWKVQYCSDIKLQYISYYTDNGNESIKRMYTHMFGKSIDKQVNCYVYEKVI